jgi:hypothetical protein
MVVENYANNDPELLGMPQAVAGIIAAGIAAGTTVAGLVANRVGNKRNIKANEKANQQQIKLQEIEAKAKAAAQANYIKIGAIAAIPIGIILFKKIKDKKAHKK